MEGREQLPQPLISRDAPPFSEQDQTAAFQRHIFQGGRLIVDGKYSEAIKHFRNKEQIKKAGLFFSAPRERLVDFVLPDEVESIANQTAMQSWFMIENRQITPAGVTIKGISLGDIPSARMTPAEKSLALEISLVHMEELLHGLQYLKGKPLAGYVDGEVDVAAYMQRNSIPLTDTFLRRYDRGLILFGREGKDDTLSTRPAFRRGTFVKVQRSNGKVESDWQIIGFNSSTGEAIVRSYLQELEKHISRTELGQLNQEGTYPFNDSKDFSSIFLTLDNLKQLHGTHDTYPADKLKKLINSVCLRQANIDKIPRSGGLRLTVAKLLGINTPAINFQPTTRSS